MGATLNVVIPAVVIGYGCCLLWRMLRNRRMGCACCGCCERKRKDDPHE